VLHESAEMLNEVVTKSVTGNLPVQDVGRLLRCHLDTPVWYAKSNNLDRNAVLEEA
jgi:hypothetical protein